MTDLSHPEHVADRRAMWRVADAVKANPCAHCINRDREVMAWGRSVCRTYGRDFPKCALDGREPKFILDEVMLR